MKITRLLKITEKEFYDYLEEELLLDIEKCTHQQLHSKDIKKGLKYSKFTQDVNARADIIIQKYQRGQIYQTRIKTLSDSIIITYQTQVTSEGLQVIFKEHIQSYESKKHHYLAKMFYELVYLRRMNETLYDIEKHIFNKRNGIEIKQNKGIPEHRLLYKMFKKQ